MKNSFRAIIFIIPFLSVVFTISFILPNLPLIEKPFVFFNILAFLFIIVFPIFQGIIRFLFYKKHQKNNKLFFKTNLGESKLKQRIIFYILIFLILIFPVVGKNFNFKTLSFQNILSVLFFMLLSEILIYISIKKTKANFMANGILILGADFRIDLPIGEPLKSNSGFYYYYEFKNYEIKKDKLILSINSYDQIKLFIDDSKKEQIIGFFNSKDIPEKKLS